jgi:NTE family protein
LINLALQGGGAHGAFTWGALDGLLAGGVQPAGLSGSSAGALNAAALASGWAVDGEAGARAALESLWMGIGQLSATQSLPWPIDGALQGRAIQTITRMASPYQFNPGGFHPLRRLLEQTLDWSGLQSPEAPPVFVAATDVETGAVRIFTRTALSVDALLASTCVPTLFQAVEIEGRFYWDGGFAANPALMPLVESGLSDDLMLIQLLPESASAMPPRRVDGILERTRELGFTTHLRRELNWLARMQADAGWLGRWSLSPLRRHTARLRFHHLQGGHSLTDPAASGPLEMDPESLRALHASGQAAGERWLRAHDRHIGRRSSRALRDFDDASASGFRYHGGPRLKDPMND